ncbi:uncharacterized protein B0H18DRAFT_100349 [Fomitopsis serialis]|uniref:uncharacterized protein n=1 Tax=Fomitopsis serialis TaxID=139415 RepID=UPI0020089008|nr:uncharacterized protein B0H18DRAFT_100349 [Neoantrodia serialis]KAH9931222.1 hypothetical protein B0H18DRAFT_100349 [Neoantrodia serialis]
MTKRKELAAMVFIIATALQVFQRILDPKGVDEHGQDEVTAKWRFLAVFGNGLVEREVLNCGHRVRARPGGELGDTVQRLERGLVFALAMRDAFLRHPDRGMRPDSVRHVR